jgi:signal transduction histidine kinase
MNHLLEQFRLPAKGVISRASDRRVTLTARLTLVIAIVTALYMILDLFIVSDIKENVFIALLICCVVTLVLNGKGYHRLAKIIGLSLFNIIIYTINSSEGYETGVHLHQITAGFAAMVLFGYEERLYGIFFGLLSAVLYVVSYAYHYSYMDYRVFSESEVKIFFMINCTIYVLICGYLLLELLKFNTITEKALLDQNQQLAKTNQELDRFVYSASHDLRAPLRSLLGLIEVTQKTQSPEELEYCFNMMKDRVHNMDAFIKEIIDFSRNARLAVKKEPVVLFDLIQETIDDLKFAEGLEQIYVRVDVAREYQITTDKARLKVVLNNLIGNAFKYSDLQKENQEVAIRASVEGNTTRIDITDNGVGIDAEHHQKIFEMFYRASEQSNGSGLGLYIVRETLARLNGSIQVKSVVGQGSTFTLSLPNQL